MKIYLKMIKQWSRSTKPGMIIPFDESKGRRVIAGGFAVEVPNPKSETAAAKAKAKAKAEAREKAEAKAKAKAETAMVNPAAETADGRPDLGPKPALGGNKNSAGDKKDGKKGGKK